MSRSTHGARSTHSGDRPPQGVRSPRRPRPPVRAASRRALRGHRPAGGKVARRAPRRVQGGRRRAPHDHAQLRPWAPRRRPDGGPGGRTRRARHAPGRAHARRRAAALRAPRGGRAVIYARRAWIVLWKDFLSERRSKETLNALFFFALLLLFLFQFALGADRERLTAALPGLLWLGFILSGLVGLVRAILAVRVIGCLDGLVMMRVGK